MDYRWIICLLRHSGRENDCVLRVWGYGRPNLFSSRVYADQDGAEDSLAAKIENGCIKARQASLSKFAATAEDQR